MHISKAEIITIKDYIHDSDVIFDVGAAKGDWTNEVLKRHTPLAVHLFEPIPSICNMLYKRYDSDKRIIINCCAVSNIKSIKNFCIYPEYLNMSSIYQRRMEVEKKVKIHPNFIDVYALSLDEYCREKEINIIDFLKIDTEGSEYDILKGAVGLLLEHKIKKIQFEYGECFLDAGFTLKEVFRFLQDIGYSIAEMTNKGLKPIKQFTCELENYKWTNFLASIRKD